MSLFESKAVKAVRRALAEAGAQAQVVRLEKTARSAREAAEALDVPQGAIVKTLVFLVGSRPVLALVAGDQQCAEEALPRALNLEGEVTRPDADQVRAATGFAIGGVSPVGLPDRLPTVIDASLKRFGAVYAAAGHPHYIFATTPAELKKLTGGIVSYNITEGEKKHPMVGAGEPPSLPA